MILSYKDATTKEELDVVTITTDDVSYKTGLAQSTVESKVDLYGSRGAMALLKSWSNGYVLTEVVG